MADEAGLRPESSADGVDWQEIGQRVLQQTIDLWVRPEIDRRRERGILGSSFRLWGAQVIFDPDAKDIQVRLNEEIGGVFIGRTKAGLKPKVGDVLQGQDIEPEGFQLSDQDANAGHLTLLLHKGRWFISFDFRRNAGRIADTISAAREFLDAATSELTNGRLRPFIELLFAASELTAKAELLEIPGRELRDRHGHGLITSKYNWWGRLGNVPAEHVSLLNRLTSLRPAARYVRGDFHLPGTTAMEMLKTAQDALECVEVAAPKRYPSKATDATSDSSALAPRSE